MPRLKAEARKKPRNRAKVVNDLPPERLAGRRVVAVRAMTAGEVTQEGWELPPHLTPVGFELDDGTFLFAGGDLDGTRPGLLLGNDPRNRPFAYRPTESGVVLARCGAGREDVALCVAAEALSVVAAVCRDHPRLTNRLRRAWRAALRGEPPPAADPGPARPVED